MSEFVEVSIPKHLLADLLTVTTTPKTNRNKTFLEDSALILVKQIATSALGQYAFINGELSNEES